MNVSRTSRGRNLLPLLTISLSLASFPMSARADVFVSSLTDRTTPGEANSLSGRPSAQVVFRARRFEEDGEHAEQSAIAPVSALAMIFVLPPGLTPMSQPVMSSVVNQQLVPPAPVHVADNGNPTPASGGGQDSGGGSTASPTTPEPASLLLALTGSGAAALAVLIRRRRNGEP